MQPLQVLPTEQSLAGDFARQLAMLLGPAYAPSDSSRIGQDLLALGGALAGAHATNLAALNEAFADTAVQLLSELEAEHGLQVRPDLTTPQRQARLVAKIRAAFSGTPQDMLTAVRTLAPEATILETRAADVAGPDLERRRAVFRFAVTLSLAHLLDANIVGQLRAILDQMKPAHTGYTLGLSIGFFCDDPNSLTDATLLRI